jgi:hypothetical protein
VVIRNFDLRRNRQARTPACSLLRASCPPPFGSVSLRATDQNRSRRFCQPFARTPLQNWFFAALQSAAGMPFLFSAPDMNIRRRKVKPDRPVSQSKRGEIWRIQVSAKAGVWISRHQWFTEGARVDGISTRDLHLWFVPGSVILITRIFQYSSITN